MAEFTGQATPRVGENGHREEPAFSSTAGEEEITKSCREQLLPRGQVRPADVRPSRLTTGRPAVPVCRASLLRWVVRTRGLRRRQNGQTDAACGSQRTSVKIQGRLQCKVSEGSRSQSGVAPFTEANAGQDRAASSPGLLVETHPPGGD